MYLSVVVAVMGIGVPVYFVLAVVGVVPSVVKKIVADGSEAVRRTACAVLKSPPPGLGVTATPERGSLRTEQLWLSPRTLVP
jgi:hypothetical protein